MMKTIAPDQMRSLEQRIMKATGTTGLSLMEKAAAGVAEQVEQLIGDKEKQALFLCGPGNNGGDGLAAARLYRAAGGRALVWYLPGERRGDSLVNQRRLESLFPDVALVPYEYALEIPEDVGCIVDALFGTGLERPLAGLAADLVCQVNGLPLPVLAVDIPSGLHGETGRVMGYAIRADKTLTFHRPKPGLYLGDGLDFAGEVTVWDIGLPPDMDDVPGMEILTPADIRSYIGPRKKNSHKGDYGRILLVAGSFGMAGAACIAAEAALRAGAGLVTVACPETIVPILQQAVPCATCLPLPMAGEILAKEAASKVEKAARQADVVAMGPGMGISPDRWPLVESVLQGNRPTVWDADALTLLSRHKPAFSQDGLRVFTPHPGEAARLLGVGVGPVVENPEAAAKEISRRYRCAVVLKGAASLITCEGETALNVTGTPAMAKGGSGDALTGIMAAFLYRFQGYGLVKTAQLACWIHGRAGQLAAQKTGENGLLATDLVAHIGKAMEGA